jgi:hypothetical protein
MKISFSKIVFSIFVFCVLTIGAAFPVWAQMVKPELCVINFCIGADEEKVKAMMPGYSPRYDNERNQPKYFFYNAHGNEVMAITAHSKERPHLIVGIEAFFVSESYQNKHYQMKNVTSFMTESGFFIGYRQSVTSLVFAVPHTTQPQEVISKKGKPEADEKSGKIRTLHYRFDSVNELSAAKTNLKDVKFGAYKAEFRFAHKKLSRFNISADTSLLTP